MSFDIAKMLTNPYLSNLRWNISRYNGFIDKVCVDMFCRLSQAHSCLNNVIPLLCIPLKPNVTRHIRLYDFPRPRAKTIIRCIYLVAWKPPHPTRVILIYLYHITIEVSCIPLTKIFLFSILLLCEAINFNKTACLSESVIAFTTYANTIMLTFRQPNGNFHSSKCIKSELFFLRTYWNNPVFHRCMSLFV